MPVASCLAALLGTGGRRAKGGGVHFPCRPVTGGQRREALHAHRDLRPRRHARRHLGRPDRRGERGASATWASATCSVPATPGTALRGGRAMLTLGFERAEGCDGRATWRSIPEAPPALRGGASATRPRSTRAPWRRWSGCAPRGYRTGICTNKPERLSEILMDRLGARHLFDSLVGADTLAVRKPDPEPLREAGAPRGRRSGPRLPRRRQRHRPRHRARGGVPVDPRHLRTLGRGDGGAGARGADRLLRGALGRGRGPRPLGHSQVTSCPQSGTVEIAILADPSRQLVGVGQVDQHLVLLVVDAGHLQRLDDDRLPLGEDLLALGAARRCRGSRAGRSGGRRSRSWTGPRTSCPG